MPYCTETGAVHIIYQVVCTGTEAILHWHSRKEAFLSKPAFYSHTKFPEGEKMVSISIYLVIKNIRVDAILLRQALHDVALVPRKRY